MISVIIPSYNSDATVIKCLDSLQCQDFSGQYEVIFIDSSTDRTPKIVASRYPDVSLVHLDQKTDPGTARNIGIGKAKGELLAFIDADCYAPTDWLSRIYGAHDSQYGIIGGSVANGNKDNDFIAWAGYISEFREFIPQQTKKEVNHIPTCNISYKKSIFKKYGLFNGDYYPQEDLVYNYNLSKNGEKILFDPAVQVYHHHRSVLKDFLHHQYKIGRITSKVLKVIPLEGSFVARNPLFALFIIPFLPLVKFARTIFVFLKLQPGVILKRPLVLPMFALGLMYWVIGFAQGVYARQYRIDT